MRAVGIIAEYNPFHSGHALQLSKARKACGADAVIVAMSGAFTQRGAPALIDKWTRSEMAIAGGADMVIELPCLFALREAQGFAAGGVNLLNSCGIVDAISFGCESDGIAYIERVARCIAGEPEPYRAMLKEHLAAGKSYPRARAEAAAQYLGIPEGILNNPNFSLALEYAQANFRLETPLTLLPIERTNAYHGLELEPVASAAAIRAAIARDDTAGALAAMPVSCRTLFAKALDQRADGAFLDDLILFKLRSMTPAELKAYPGVSEGLENLICRQARLCTSTAEVLSACKSKRYTYSRLRRLLSQSALGITREMQAAHALPTYIRVLACRQRAMELLGEIKRRGRLPLILSARDAPTDDPIWLLETRATDLWGLCTQSQQFRRAGCDYTRKFAPCAL